MFTISQETAADHGAIESLLDQGFGPDRQTKTVYRLRLGAPVPELSFTARCEDRFAGTLRFWPVCIGAATPALLLGPLAVAGDLQGRGIGRGLVAHGLETAAAEGWRLCLVVGRPDYYTPFGFEPALPWNLALPGPVDADRFQVRALSGGDLAALLPATDRQVSTRRWVRGGGLAVRSATGRAA